MSNTIDLQPWPEQSNMVPAINPVVYVDGCLCQYLVVNEITLAGNPDFSKAKLSYNEALVQGSDEDEVLEALAVGRRISICQVYDKGIGEGISGLAGLFEGSIEQIERRVDGQGYSVEVTAFDFSAMLDRIAVHGQRVFVSSNKTLFLSGFESVFNPDGVGNCCREMITRDGKSYRVFSQPGDAGKTWSLAEIVLYLFSEYLPFGMIEISSLEQLEAIMGHRIADELDIEGDPMLEALGKICKQSQVQFRFVSRYGNEGACAGVVFYRPGQGRKVELNIQRRGQGLNVSRTNIYKFISKSCWPVTNRYVVKGANKVFEATFELVKAWNPEFEGGSSQDYSTASSSFGLVKDVYRKWCLNEAGDYTPLPYGQGEPFDFTRVFETSEFLSRRRRFYGAISYDSDGQSIGYYLEVSYNDGQDWEQYSGQFQVLKNQCGIWLSTGEFETSIWDALQADDFRVRITASVESDERLTCEYTDGPVNSTVEVQEHILSNGAFEYRKVSCDSMFAGSAYEADEVDDTASLMGYIRQHCHNNTSVIEDVAVETSYVMTGFQPGDRVVSSPESMALLNAGHDGRSRLWIEKVCIDFDKQSTQLEMVKGNVLK